MSRSSYFNFKFKDKSDEFIDGVIEGVRLYAWWKDGVEYVGTTGRKLKDVIQELENCKRGKH